MQAARADALQQHRVGRRVGQRMVGAPGQLFLAQLGHLAFRQERGEHQAGGRTEQRQHRADLGDHRHRAHRLFHLYHGGATVAPDGEEAGLVELVAQLGQRRGGALQHVHAVQRRQAHAQGLAPQRVMIGGGVLDREAAGDQCLQIAMDLARRHPHMLRQARQRGRRGEFGEGLEDIGTDFGGADLLLAGGFGGTAVLFHGRGFLRAGPTL